MPAVHPLIIGNWKMNGSHAAIGELLAIDRVAERSVDMDVILCLPAPLIASAKSALRHALIGGQDCHSQASGAFTGGISAAMLADAGATHIIVGHSESRQGQALCDHDVALKARAAAGAGLKTIICVGESSALGASKVLDQLREQVLHSVPDDAEPAELIIAYEPVWAIGSGRTPTPDRIADVHATLREALADRFGAATISIVYGGSVSPANAESIFAIPGVDGMLVGSASLTAESFGPIIASATTRPMPYNRPSGRAD